MSQQGLDFAKTVAFMLDTTNVMKDTRSGVQKLIRNEHPNLYDVGCICHMVDLTVKALTHVYSSSGHRSALCGFFSSTVANGTSNLLICGTP